MAAKRSKLPKCVECGVPLPARRLRAHAVTSSARCGHERQRRMTQRRPLAKRPVKKDVQSETTPAPNPPILGVSLIEAAERVGVSRAMTHILCVKHGLGRMCNDGCIWLTLAELRTLTVQPWR